MHVLTMDFAHIRGTCSGIYKTITPCVYRPQDMKYLSWVEGDGGSSNIQEDLAYQQAGVHQDLYVFAFGVVPPKTGGNPNPYFTALGGTGTLATCTTNLYGCGPLDQTSPNFEHDCAGHTLAIYENPDWLGVNWTNPPSGIGGPNTNVVRAFTLAFITPAVNAGLHPDAWYIDGNHTPWGMHDVDNFTAGGTEPCVSPPLPLPSYSDTAMGSYLALEVPTIDALGVPIEWDGLDIYTGSGGANTQYMAATLSSKRLIGTRMESSFVCSSNYDPVTRPDCHGTGYLDANSWVSLENQIIWSVNHGLIENLEYGGYNDLLTSAVAQAHRIYWYASIGLVYDLNLSHFWFQGAGCAIGRVSDPNNPIGECVLPESQLVMKNPVVSEPASSPGWRTASTSGIVQLQAPGGAYSRVYKDCGYQGVRIGRCIVAVNPSLTLTVPFPDTSFLCTTCHTMVLHNGPGAEIPVGGTATFDGPIPPATMAPDTAYIVVAP